MSNAVDILLIGGPADQHMVCVKRPVTRTLALLANGGEVSYSPMVYDIDGKKYRIAIPTGTELPASEVIGASIAVSQLQPAWDLN